MHQVLWPVYHPEVPDFLNEAAQSPAMQRLKLVGMNCGCEYTSFPVFQNGGAYSRYLHSVGVGLIVWHFTHDPAQALSGLLHDISTPVFAHVVDFLRGDHMTQESTEHGTEQCIRDDAVIQSVLWHLGLTTWDVMDYHRYSVADNDTPQLSADRLEYTLGNSVNYSFVDLKTVKWYYDDVVVGCNESGVQELMFRTEKTARDFAVASLRCSKVYISETDRYCMQYLAELLRDAIAAGVLQKRDLERTEPEVVSMLRGTEEFSARWAQFRALDTMVCASQPGKEPGWRQIFAKKRHIDPFVEGKGRVSALCPAYRAMLHEFLQAPQDGWLLGASSKIFG